MDESPRWRSDRTLTALLVMGVHAALVLWLVVALQVPRGASREATESVQLLLLPPKSLPKTRIESPQPVRVRSGIPLAPTPPLLTGLSQPPVSEAARQSGLDGGSGVDWAAEKRRALQAFEIRSHQPGTEHLVSRSSPAEQPWWPAHRPGERTKTADGNWIVWIDSSCYQVATSAPIPNGSGREPRTVCPDSAPPSDPQPQSSAVQANH